MLKLLDTALVFNYLWFFKLEVLRSARRLLITLNQKIRAQISVVIFGIMYRCSMWVNVNNHNGLMEEADYGKLNYNKQKPKCNCSSY